MFLPIKEEKEEEKKDSYQFSAITMDFSGKEGVPVTADVFKL